jgi:hypothetical protein
LLEIFGLGAGMIMILVLPGSLIELFIWVLLIVKGFNSSAIDSKTTKQI